MLTTIYSILFSQLIDAKGLKKDKELEDLGPEKSVTCHFFFRMFPSETDTYWEKLKYYLRYFMFSGLKVYYRL